MGDLPKMGPTRPAQKKIGTLSKFYLSYLIYHLKSNQSSLNRLFSGLCPIRFQIFLPSWQEKLFLSFLPAKIKKTILVYRRQVVPVIKCKHLHIINDTMTESYVHVLKFCLFYLFNLCFFDSYLWSDEKELCQLSILIWWSVSIYKPRNNF